MGGDPFAVGAAMTGVALFAIAWTVGATVTTLTRLRTISDDSPALRFAFAMVAWPIFWIR